MPYYFSRSSVKFQDHIGKIDDFDRHWAFLHCNPSFNRRRPLVHIASKSIDEVLYCFSRSSVKMTNPLRARLLSQSQLSNASDLPFIASSSWETSTISLASLVSSSQGTYYVMLCMLYYEFAMYLEWNKHFDWLIAFCDLGSYRIGLRHNDMGVGEIRSVWKFWSSF